MENRQGTINDINNLYEDSYKELYLNKCREYKELNDLYELQKQISTKLKHSLIICERIILEKITVAKMNDFIIEKQKEINELINKRKK